MTRKFLILSTFVFVSSSHGQGLKCPYPESAIEPELTVQSTSKGGGQFEYSYSIKNVAVAKVPIRTFWVETSSEKNKIVAPSGWRALEGAPTAKQFVNWSTASSKNMIVPNGELSGFAFLSSGRPGVVRAYFRGHNPAYIKNVVYSDLPRKESTSCPGFWEQGSSTDGDDKIAVLATGPIPENQLSPEVVFQFPEGKKWFGSSFSAAVDSLEVSPLKEGKIQIAILEGGDLNLNKIDKKSLRFGRGQAVPEAVVLGKARGDGKDAKALIATFDLGEVNPLCGVDRALFLEGKANENKTIFSGVRIKGTPCSIETWAKEVPKIMDRRDPNNK